MAREDIDPAAAELLADQLLIRVCDTQAQVVMTLTLRGPYSTGVLDRIGEDRAMQLSSQQLNVPASEPVTGGRSAPTWPRRVARILGSLGLILLTIVISLNVLNYLGVGHEVKPEHTLADSLWYAVTVIPMVIVAIGLVIAYRNEGMGAFLILAGATILTVGTLGIGLVAAVPMFAVGILYAISWATHRADTDGARFGDRTSRWIRSMYYR